MQVKFALIYETNNSAIKTNQSVLVQIQFSREGKTPQEKEKPGGGVIPQKQLLSPNLFSCPITHLYSPQRSPRISLWKFPTRQTPSLSRFFPLYLSQRKEECMDVKLPSKTPWKIDLQHFSFSRHYFEESWIGNPQAGEGIKMSSLLERGETAHFVSVHQPWRKRGKGKRLFRKKKLIYTSHNTKRL